MKIISHVRYSYWGLKHNYSPSYYNDYGKSTCPHCNEKLDDNKGGWFIRWYGLCMSCELKRLTHKLIETKPVSYKYQF
ncbi:MAG: hypothetical protein WC389_21650 [Lutibacter sp.]|jgi:hypothetical protein